MAPGKGKPFHSFLYWNLSGRKMSERRKKNINNRTPFQTEYWNSQSYGLKIRGEQDET